MTTRYIVASSRDWFKKLPKTDEYKLLDIVEITKKEDLYLEYLEKINPRYIFFPHWNWKVDRTIYDRFECVAFHTAPLPFGRGGSPIQNLIIRGVEKSPVYALKMTDTLDAGPIYDSLEVTLDGSLDEIFSRIAKCVEEMIVRICASNPDPIAQQGNAITFHRLNYADNELLTTYTIREMYDRIRMVDGEGYSRAFIKFGKYRIEFSESKIIDDELYAKVKISEDEN